MSYEPTFLELWSSPLADGTQSTPAPTPGVPARLADAGRVLDHGLLVGDALDIDTGDAKSVLDTVYNLPSELPRLFLEDALPTLRDVYGRVLERLSAALDSDGRPLGEDGARLVASEFFDQDPQGRLRVRTTHFPLDLLTQRIDQLCRILADAMARNLPVVERDVTDEAGAWVSEH
jgi:hypothetical protein